MTCVCTAVWL